MVDGPAGLLGRLTGDGHDPDDLLGAEGGRGAGAGGVGEHLLEQAQQRRLGGPLLLGLAQAWRLLEPAVAPVADGQAGQAQPPGGGLNAGVVREGQEDGGPADEALVGGLAAGEALQQGPLRRGEREGGWLGVYSWSHSGSACRARPTRLTLRSPKDSG